MAGQGEGLSKSSLIADLRSLIRKVRVRLDALRYRNLSAQETFERIYASKAWGVGHGDGFASGSGSETAFARAYVKAIKEYVRSHRISSIVDLGCGDFRVGRYLVNSLNVEYTGVDIVRPLIEHHNKVHSDARTRFLCLNIIQDPLPFGDLYLIRQVLQHLSNAQIATILDKLADQRVIITEHLPSGDPQHPNRDKAAGPDIRLYYDSGVYIEYPPFNRHLETLLEVSAPFNGRDAVLRTSLLEPQSE